MPDDPLDEYLNCLAVARGGEIGAERSERGVLADAIAETLAEVGARKVEMAKED